MPTNFRQHSVTVFFFRTALLILFILSLPILWSYVKTIYSFGTTRSPYIGDEIFVVEPAISVWEGGYKGFRCMERQTGACYGGPQSLIDGYMLRALPQEALKENPVTRFPGVPWTWLVKYPEAFKALRISRGVYILALWLLVAFLGRRIGGWASLVFMLIFACSPAALEAVGSGAKNDFPSALWEGFFLLLMSATLGLRSANGRFLLFLATIAMGMLAAFSRLSLLPFLVLSVPYFLVFELLKEASTRRLLAYSGVIGVVIPVLYFGFHPNAFVSSFEAFWFRHFFVMSNTPENFSAAFEAELSRFFRSVWLLPFLLWGMITYAKQRSVRESFFKWSYFLLISFLNAVLYLKAARGVERYYLTVVCSLLISTILVWRECRVIPRALPVLLIAGLIFFSPGIRPSSYAGLRLSLGSDEQVNELDTLLNENHESKNFIWYLDLALYPPLRASGIPKNQIHFFDSLNTSPQSLLGNLKKESLQSVKVLVACWKMKQGLNESFRSPAAEEWAKLLNTACSSRVNLADVHVFRHVQGFRPVPYVVLSGEDFISRVSRLNSVPIFGGDRLEPQFFEGAENGWNHYEMPLFLTGPINLRATFLFKREIPKITVDVKSGCKGSDTSLLMKIVQQRKVLASTKISLDASTVFCKDFGFLCHWKPFQNWSWRRYPITGASIMGPISSNQIMTVEIEIEKPADKRCPVVIEGIRFSSLP